MKKSIIALIASGALGLCLSLPIVAEAKKAAVVTANSPVVKGASAQTEGHSQTAGLGASAKTATPAASAQTQVIVGGKTYSASATSSNSNANGYSWWRTSIGGRAKESSAGKKEEINTIQQSPTKIEGRRLKSDSNPIKSSQVSTIHHGSNHGGIAIAGKNTKKVPRQKGASAHGPAGNP